MLELSQNKGMRVEPDRDVPSLRNGILSAAAVLYSHLKQNIKKKLRTAAAADRECERFAQRLLREGYVVLPGYYTSEQCARARADIDRMIKDQPEALQHDKLGADCRIFGSERASPVIRAFHDDVFCRSIGEAYRCGPLTNFSTLAARLTAIPGNLGSGQGWHRDAFHFQYKAMIYLSDVSMDNGPFEILPRSHRTVNVVRDTFTGRLDPPPASRISAEQIQRLLALAPNRSRPLAAAAGTLILFDSSTIHRGMPIQTGTRYAITNYYYPPESVTPALQRNFAPYAKG